MTRVKKVDAAFGGGSCYGPSFDTERCNDEECSRGERGKVTIFSGLHYPDV